MSFIYTVNYISRNRSILNNKFKKEICKTVKILEKVAFKYTRITETCHNSSINFKIVISKTVKSVKEVAFEYEENRKRTETGKYKIMSFNVVKCKTVKSVAGMPFELAENRNRTETLFQYETIKRSFNYEVNRINQNIPILNSLLGKIYYIQI